MLGTFAKGLLELAKVAFLFAKVSRKLGILNHYCIHIQLAKSYRPLPPRAGVWQEKGTGEFRFGSGSVHCVACSGHLPSLG